MKENRTGVLTDRHPTTDDRFDLQALPLSDDALSIKYHAACVHDNGRARWGQARESHESAEQDRLDLQVLPLPCPRHPIGGNCLTNAADGRICVKIVAACGAECVFREE